MLDTTLCLCGLAIEQTPQAPAELVEDKVHHVEVVAMLEALAYTVHRISCEVKQLA